MPGDLEERLGTALVQNHGTLATAESCSGGLIASRITDVPGSSVYFLGGVVAYSNPAKIAMLGVNESTLAWHGAVSEPVAREMAAGAHTRFGSDFAIACTGIAGPGGGSIEKPVGLVYIGVTAHGETAVHRFQFNGDRESIKRQTADEALRLVLEAME